MIIDSVDAYLAEAGSIDKAALLPGQFLAWCANMQLLDEHFENDFSRVLVRARFREIAPSELFIVTCGGELSDRVLTERGQQFARTHYDAFRQETKAELGESLYEVENEWWLYERSGAWLTARLLGKVPSSRPWWQFWKARA